MPEQSNTLNRYGQCPICEFGWDAGDMFEVLSRLDVFKAKTQREILQIAQENYGYTEANKLRFSALNSIDLTGSKTGTGFWQCPRCGGVWDKVTNQYYRDLSYALSDDLPPF